MVRAFPRTPCTQTTSVTRGDHATGGAPLRPTAEIAVVLWGEVGVTQMPGIDDYGAAETFPTASNPIAD